ncbi:MAG: CHAT domain-containing protein [Bacteroidota bacterium]
MLAVLGVFALAQGTHLFAQPEMATYEAHLRQMLDQEFSQFAINRADERLVAVQELSQRLAGQISPKNPAEYGKWCYLRGLETRMSGDPEASFNWLRQSDSIWQRLCPNGCLSRARVELELGRHYYNTADFNASKLRMESALNLFRREAGTNQLEQSDLLSILGKIAARRAEYSLALDLQGQVRAIRTELFGPESYQVAKTDISIGNIYYNTDRPAEAGVAYERALAIIRDFKNGSPATLASLLINLAATQDQLQQFGAAIANAQEAITGLRKAYGPHHPYIITTQGNIGLMYHRMGNADRARYFLGKAAKMAREHLGPSHPLFGQIIGDFAYVEAENNRVEIALQLIQETLHAAAPGVSPTDWRVNPPLGDVIYPTEFRNAITYKADLITRLASERADSLDLLALALQCYDLFAASLDQVWLEYRDPGDKLYLNRGGVNEYERAIQCAARLAHATQDPRWHAEIFAYMERGKCQVMLEHIRRSRAAYLAGIPDALRQRSTQLREVVHALNFEVQTAELAPDSLQQLRIRLIETRLELDAFTDSLERAFPGFGDLTGQKPRLSLEDVQQHLRAAAAPKTVLLEYFLGDADLYVVAIDPEQTRFRQVALDTNFKDTLQTFLNLVTYPHPTTWRLREYDRLGHKLYQLLLGPELAGPESPKRLRIIPDGMLAMLPFDALVVRPAEKPPRKFSQLNLLIHDHIVSYAGAAPLLIAPRETQTAAVTSVGFAWSSPNIPVSDTNLRVVNNRPWPHLPGAGQEIAYLKDRLKGDFFAGEAASEAQFKALAGEYGLLHLALHGNSGGEEPFIVFPSPGDSTEDGVLYLHELYSLPLRARLAVLSACETGSGALERGEGVMSVASGFETAGCPAVIMSVWPVADDAGPGIMRGFYDGLVRGMPVDEALRDAKLAYMRSGGTFRASPFYWAPFIALGDVRPIPLRQKAAFPLGWLAGGLLVLASGAGVWWWKKRAAQSA